MTWLRSISPRFVLFTAAVATVGACNNDPQTGNLTVNYELGLGAPCDAFGVSTVRVTLGTGEYEEEQACDPSEPLVMDGIAVGTYDVLIEGVDANGVTVMDNLDLPETDNTVEIIGGSSRTLDTTLAAAPAIIKVRWQTLSDGFQANCEFYPVKFFEVTAFRNLSNTLLIHEFPCSVPSTPDTYQTVPDPGRDIDGTSLDGVRVRALDESKILLSSVVATFDPPGPGQIVRVDVTCDGPSGDPTCTGMVVGIVTDTTTDDGGADTSGG